MTREEKIQELKRKTKENILQIKESLKNDWDETCKTSILPEYVLEEFIEDLNWKIVCTHQHLSESFMRKFKREIDWTIATKTQKMSETFIEEMESYVDWYALFYSKDLSKEFIAKHISKFSLWIDNWHKKDHGPGTINSQSNWFDGSLEGASQKQTLISNLLKADEMLIWEEDFKNIGTEELDYLLQDEEEAQQTQG